MMTRKLFTEFSTVIFSEDRLNPTHISLYFALLQFWNRNDFQNPIIISRSELMPLSKISSYGTYHKCMRELNDFKIIEYLPSFNPFKGSMVNMLDIKNLTCPKTNKQRVEDKSISQIEFQKPLFNEVVLYFEERNHLKTEAKEFFQFYEEQDWRLSNSHQMKCWRAAARNWLQKAKV